MVNDMKNIKCQDNNLWNLHVEGKHRVENFNSLIISSNRVNFSFFFFFFHFKRSIFLLKKRTIEH